MLPKAQIQTAEYQEDFQENFFNLVGLDVYNYGAQDVTLFFNDYPTVIPAAVNGVPQFAFRLGAGTYLFDAKIRVEIPVRCLVVVHAVYLQTC